MFSLTNKTVHKLKVTDARAIFHSPHNFVKTPDFTIGNQCCLKETCSSDFGNAFDFPPGVEVYEIQKTIVGSEETGKKFFCKDIEIYQVLF